MTAPRPITLRVNGQSYTRSVEPRLLLADFLRHDLGLTGTHIGCEHGVCGACTVMIDGQSARACLHFAAALDGAEIRTIEAVASEDALHPVQAAFRRNHALQCGFCTPGMVLTAVELLDKNPAPCAETVRETICNNICRCTGYNTIVAAVMDAAADMRGDQSATE